VVVGCTAACRRSPAASSLAAPEQLSCRRSGGLGPDPGLPTTRGKGWGFASQDVIARANGQIGASFGAKASRVGIDLRRPLS